MTHSDLSLFDRLRLAWERVLGPGSDNDSRASFFELGGDSLRVVQLWTQIETFYEGAIDVDRFLSDPSLDTMYKILSGSDATNPDGMAFIDISPLPHELYSRFLVSVAQWPGGRPTADRLIASFNTDGSKVPIFMICQAGEEAGDLAAALGADQPLFAARSGLYLTDYAPEQEEKLFARYLADLEVICPEGPIVIVGNCRGSLLAEPLAMELRRRGRDVPLLVIIEWHFGVLRYTGRGLLMFGSDSIFAVPDADLEEATLQRFEPSRFSVSRIPGKHADLSTSAMARAILDNLGDKVSALQILPLRPDLEGARIRAANSPDLWLVYQGQRHRITSEDVYSSLFADDRILEVESLDDIEEGAPLAIGASLIKAKDLPHIYMLNRRGNQILKHHISSYEVFEKFGFDLAQIRNLEALVVEGLPEGRPLRLADVR